MDAFAKFEKTIDIPVLKQQPASTTKIDFQVLLDEDMMKKWDEATSGKETTAALIAINEILLHDANTSYIMGDLVQLVEQYARLSLAGSCSAQVRSAISYLEGLEGLGGGIAPRINKERLDYMKRKLEFFNEVERTHREEHWDRK